MQQLWRRLGRADLGGMNAHAERDDHRLAFNQCLGGRLVQRPRVRQPQGVGADLFKPSDILWRRNHGRDQSPAFGGGTGVDQLDAVGRGRDGLEVTLEAWPVGQFSIGAHPEPERRFGRLDGRRRLRAE
jgi:hypothetical protein